MGITLPKLPLMPRKKLHVKKPQTGIVPPPEWVEQIDGYFVSSCMWHDSGRFDGCFVVEYVPNDRSFSGDRGFVKIYAAGGMNETPFVQMKGIWKELHEDNQTHSMTYDITEDGRIYSAFGESPSDDNIRGAIYDIGSMYDDWKDFPNAQDWDTACKLREAKSAVDNMRVEAKYGYEQKNIDNLRKKIKEIQTQIAESEKSLNEMYERAADGITLLEQHGIAVNLDEEPKEPEKQSVDCDIASLYPTSLLKFIGEATIVRMQDGSYVVTPKPLNHHPNAGDIVVDRSNGMTAVYSYGKWEVVNP
jgi:hypothetical protein